MGPSPSEEPRVLLLDIEGTTTPVDFVYQVLFPYARARLALYAREAASSGALGADLDLLRREHEEDRSRGANPPTWSSGAADEELRSLAAYAAWLMDQDRKSTGLKSLQGKIWEAGYRTGRLRGEVYDDVPRAFERWSAQGRRVAIFSSGSVLAQKLLFGQSTAGDLTGWIADYFDTTIGAKRDPESYRRIAGALECLPPQVLFVSDVVEELEAARATAMHTATLCVRPGSRRPEAAGMQVIETFDELFR
ncbi:MAG: acireductone synthase [Acidobacteria bacterium]|nr:MAG: acireductone synthase [Acidobacteriota bacterium]